MAEPPARSVELVQTGAVVAAIALALAALLNDKHPGPVVRVYHPLIITLLTGGVFCLTGTAYAMYALWCESGLTKADVWPFRGHRPATEGALVAIAWGLFAILIAFIWLLIGATP